MEVVQYNSGIKRLLRYLAVLTTLLIAKLLMIKLGTTESALFAIYNTFYSIVFGLYLYMVIECGKYFYKCRVKNKVEFTTEIVKTFTFKDFGAQCTEYFEPILHASDSGYFIEPFLEGEDINVEKHHKWVIKQLNAHKKDLIPLWNIFREDIYNAIYSDPKCEHEIYAGDMVFIFGGWSSFTHIALVEYYDYIWGQMIKKEEFNK